MQKIELALAKLIELALAKLAEALHLQQIGRATKPIHLWTIIAIGIVLGVVVSPEVGLALTGVAAIASIWAIFARVDDTNADPHVR